MNVKLKQALELVFSNRIWIGASVKEPQVAQFIGRNKPMASSIGLKRFGPASDGGYLIPDDLDEVIACISPGVSGECGFDDAIAALGIDVYMADGSIVGPPHPHSRFHFIKAFLDTYNSDDTITVDDLCKSVRDFKTGKDFIMQMDIEGAEYRVLHSMDIQLLQRFRIMVIEFHDLDQVFSRFAFPIINSAFRKLAIYHHVVHVHPNNCCGSACRGNLDIPRVMEFTFLRKDRGKFSNGEARSFPHPLDADNVTSKRSLNLPACWL